MNTETMKNIKTATFQKKDWNSISDWVDEDLLLYIRKNLSVNHDEATNIFQEVKKFLLVVHNHSTYDRCFTPSKIVDDAWHSFILFTPIYSKFCREALGRESVIGHIPNIGTWANSQKLKSSGQANNQYNETLELISFETGELIEKYWPTPRTQNSQDCSNTSTCHGCDGSGGGSGDCDGSGNDTRWH